MGSANSRRAIAGADEGLGGRARVARGDACAWERIYSETLSTWKYSAVLWGFEPRVDYTNNVKARLQPWCCGGRYFSVRHDSPADVVVDRPYFLVTITETCFRQETHVRLPCAYRSRLHVEPEPSGHYLKPVQVVGYREGIAVLQVNANDGRIEFLVVHMKTAAVVGRHEVELAAGGRHYLCEALVSPDLGSFVVKPNAMYVLNFCRAEYRNVVELVSCRGRDGRRPPARRLFDGSAVRLFVAFDPRYRWRRLAVGNWLRAGRDAVCLYDVESELIVAESDPSHYQTTHNIVYSPDGNHLASLVLGRSVKDGLFNFPRVLVYSTADLTIVRAIRTSYLAEVPTLSPSALFPLFSETGTHLAIAYGEQGTFYQQVAGVHVYKMPVLLDLQSLCRLTIRDFFDSQDVERLPLPTKLKSYLRFQPSYG